MTGLRRHVPQFAIDWMLDAPERLWQAVDGTLCFADISGFTALSERLSRRGRIGGEELVETLSRVFGGMLDTARQRDGSLLKFGGDALLFLFTGDDHTVRAAGAAAEMRRALRRAREIPTSVGPLDLSMSVGLHSGNIHLFLVGSTHRELVLAGPDASLPAVIESSARAGEIGLSAAAAARLPARAVRPRDDGLPLLRWRKAPSPPTGPAPQRPVTEELLWRLFPRALGEVLARGAPEPEHRVACIGFARFSGTDRRLQEDGPDALAAALQSTIGAAQDILATEDVTLLAVDIDRDGGKLFLGSGVPQASEDDEGRMLRALRRLADAGTPLPLQIGVNRGHVFAAEVGTPWRAAYSAMGDTTNTAARICAKAPPGTVYAHPSVLARARTKYAAEAEGPFTFKGKKTPQVVYRVGGESATRAGNAADDGARSLVGRSAELHAMSEVTNALAAGTGGVLLVTGAAGLGKSRLLRAALETLGDPPPLLQLRGEPYEATRPYHVFRDAVRAALGIEAERADARREQLLAGLARTDPALTPFASLLGDVVQVDVPPSAEVQAIDPKYRQDRIADVLIEVLAGLSTGAQVITVEDAQWADTASSRLLDRLASACETRPWLMLVARRDGKAGFDPADARRIDLGPMPDRDMAELVNAATVTTPLRPHELDLVVRRAGGNPLFAEEIVRAGREAGSFEAVPDSLEAALAARVDTLDPEARRVLRYATVLGRSFRVATLHALLSTEGVRVDAGVLSRLGDFLEPERDEGLRFRAGLLRKTVYESLSFRRRLRLHRRAGEVLEQLAVDPDAEADALALHFGMAGDHERTWRYARLAGDGAARAYANADAAKLYRMALEAARRLPAVGTEERRNVWVARGNVCRLAGLFDEALDAYRQAARLAGDDPLVQADLLRLRALARDRAGAFGPALRELTAGTRILAGIETGEARRMRARLAAFAAMIRVGQERYRQALAQGLAAAELARAAGESGARAQALVAAGTAQMWLGSGGAEWMREALKIYQDIGDLSSEAMVGSNLGAAALIEGRWDDALSWFEIARANELKAGNHVGAACVDSNRAEIYVRQGRLAEAEPLLSDAIRVMRASRFHEGAAYAEIQLGRLLIARGDARAADELLARVGEEFMRYGRKSSALEAALVRALAKVRLGEASEALELIDRAVAAEDGASSWLVPQAAESRARALAALGLFEDAEEHLTAGLAAAREQGLRYEEGTLLRARLETRAAAGCAPDESDVRRSAEILAALGVRRAPGAA